uniref:Defensin n=1 Tax=Rhipicephalus sanguineus TaxID=34632 RepID=C9W1J1_RHISA
MSAANSAFLLIVLVIIATINTSTTSSWAISGTCLSPGAPCSYPDNSTCRGVCKCAGFRDTFGWTHICMEPSYVGWYH